MILKSTTILTKNRISSHVLPRLFSTQVISIENKKDEYYKKLGKADMQFDENIKPKGWNEALSFEALPGPKPLPLIGNVHRFLPGGTYHRKALHEFYALLHEHYGNIVALRGLPARKALVLIYDPEDMEMMLRNEGAWPVRYGLLPFVHYRTVTRKEMFRVGGVLTVQGEEWFKFRSKVNPILMEPRMIKLQVDKVDGVADVLIDFIKYHASKSPVNELPSNFQQELYKWALESVGAVALDTKLGCMDVNLPKDAPQLQYIADVNRMFELVYKLEIMPSFWKYVPTPSWTEFVQILDRLTAVTIKYIDETMAKPDDPNIPDHQKSIARRLTNIDKPLAIAMTIDMMMAGVDTTGKTLGAALYFLARNPETQAKLREEVLTKLPSKTSKLTADDLSRAPYLRAVVKETTRIAPIAVGTLRKTVRNLVLSGYQIPRGTEVLTMNLHTSNHEKYFKRPKDFIPERWLKSMVGHELSYKNTNSFAFIPFGFGPRQCIGRRLANLEVEVALLKLIRNFEFSWHHKDMRFDSTLLYGLADPLKLRVKEIEH